MEQQEEYKSEKDGVKAVCVDEGVKCADERRRKRERVETAIEYLKKYINTYDQQFEYKDYSDEIIIDDILYGLGVALDDKYKFANGFAKFKELLKKHLST